MAIFSRSRKLYWSQYCLKLLLISTGLVSMAVILKLSIPLVSEFLVYAVPMLWNSLRSWLRPPYLYAVINAIIILIVVSSRSQQKLEEQRNSVPQARFQADLRPTEYMYNHVIRKNPAEIVDLVDKTRKNPAKSAPESDEALETTVYDLTEGSFWNVRAMVLASKAEEENDDQVLLNRTDSMETLPGNSLSSEKIPAVSAGFGHRRAVSSILEAGNALNTLETTWKMITEGRSMPLARPLKKSDTWERHVGQHDSGPQLMRSEAFNFNEATDSCLTLTWLDDSGKIRREPSLSQDELNRRAEAFIQNFKEEMRLQREKSLEQYSETINRN